MAGIGGGGGFIPDGKLGAQDEEIDWDNRWSIVGLSIQAFGKIHE